MGICVTRASPSFCVAAPQPTALHAPFYASAKPLVEDRGADAFHIDIFNTFGHASSSPVSTCAHVCLLHAFSFLPLREVVSCGRACKSWGRLLFEGRTQLLTSSVVKANNELQLDRFRVLALNEKMKHLHLTNKLQVSYSTLLTLAAFSSLHTLTISDIDYIESDDQELIRLQHVIACFVPPLPDDVEPPADPAASPSSDAAAPTNNAAAAAAADNNLISSASASASSSSRSQSPSHITSSSPAQVVDASSISLPLFSPPLLHLHTITLLLDANDQTLLALSYCTSLRNLALPLRRNSKEAIAHLQRLRLNKFECYFDATADDAAEIDALLIAVSHWPLLELRLYVPLRYATSNAMQLIGKHDTLQYLNVSSASANMSSCYTVNSRVSRVVLRSAAALQLARLTQLRQLTFLKLYYGSGALPPTNIKELVVVQRDLSGISYSSSLQHLELDCCSGSLSWSDLSKLKSLQSLNVIASLNADQAHLLPDDGSSALMECRELRVVRFVRQTLLSSKCFAALRSLPHLEHLNASGCAQLLPLIKKLKNTTLKSLYIAACVISSSPCASELLGASGLEKFKQRGVVVRDHAYVRMKD